MNDNKDIKVEETTENKQPVPSNNNALMQTKSNKGLIITLIIIIILLIGALLYFIFFNKPNNETKLQTNPIPTVDLETTPANEQENDNYLEVYVIKEYTDGRITTEITDTAEKVRIKVETPNAKLVSYDGYVSIDAVNFFLYDDNGIKLYDIKSNKITKIAINRDYKEYYLNISDDGKNVLGITCIDKNDESSYYNLKTKKEMYKNKYKLPEEQPFISVGDQYIYALTKDMTYLLSTDSEKVILSSKNDPKTFYGNIYIDYSYNGKNIYTEEICFEDGCNVLKVYDDKFNVFIDKTLYAESSFSFYNGSLYINDNNIVKKYNMNGELVDTKDFSGETVKLIKNYAIYIKNQKVILENIDDGSERKEISSITENQSIDIYMSRYYEKEYLEYIDEPNKTEGLYIVIEYQDKDSKGNYGMEYCYTPNKQVVEYPIKQMIGGRAKPVLYLYPTKETNIEVKFENPNLLTTTYPKYKSSWNVKVSPNGDMKDKDGKYYYALYWDEKRYNEVDFHEGFYVESKNAIKFLEEKLSIIGLNDKERNEFIMYWLPIMENNKKNLVYFELTKERELGNKLIINPKPDSLLRVSIHIKKVNEKVNIKEQKLEAFTRVGFTAVEWGGMTY